MITNSITHGDCIEVMERMSANSVDFVLTDPPYLVNYRPHKNNAGQIVPNDVNEDWLVPSFTQMYRILKPDTLAVSFYGWHCIDKFSAAWRTAGFSIVGHFAFVKSYASSKRYLRCQHEPAYLLAKGRPRLPETPVPDVIDWTYTGNRLHPTQKPLSVLKPLIESFTAPSEVVLDPFAGSGSTCAAAFDLGRKYIGIELDASHHRTAIARMQRRLAKAAA